MLTVFAVALGVTWLIVLVWLLNACRGARRVDDDFEAEQIAQLLYAQRINTVTPLGRRTPPDRGP